MTSPSPAAAPSTLPRRGYVLLDRDGTLIVERHYLSDPDGVELLPGAAAGLRRLSQLGLGLLVVTNQSGVGRGLFTEATVDAIHVRLSALLAAEGVEIEHYFSCPHLPEAGCACRKPLPGMGLAAAERFGFDPRAAFVIGDKPCDIELGQALGATTLLVLTGYGWRHAGEGCAPDHVVDDLSAAATRIAALLDRPGAAEDPFTTIEAHFAASIAVKSDTAQRCGPAITAAARLITARFQAGGKLLLCGNGGSAADCQHMAAELTSRLTKAVERPGLPALALTTDTSFLTAYANDCGFAGIFARQVQALGRPGDVLLGISTSGSSENVLLAADEARRRGMAVITLTGAGGKLAALSDVNISVPSEDTQFVQESHLAIEHILCALVERALFAR